MRCKMSVCPVAGASALAIEVPPCTALMTSWPKWAPMTKLSSPAEALTVWLPESAIFHLYHDVAVCLAFVPILVARKDTER